MLTTGQKIRLARLELKLSQEKFGERVGVTRSAVSQWEKDETTPTGPNLVEIARALKKSPSWFVDALAHTREIDEDGDEEIEQPRRLVPIVGYAHAGEFKENVDNLEPISYLEDEPDARFLGVPRYSLIVRGPSMDRIFPEGTRVICVKYIDIKAQPVVGEYVDVTRRLKNGLWERTLKVLAEYQGVRYLEPRSYHPAHQEPITIDPNGEDDEVVIRGRVIRAIADF